MTDQAPTSIGIVGMEGASLRLTTDLPDIDREAFALLAGAYIPGARLHHEGLRPAAGAVVHVQSDSPAVAIDGSTVTLHDRWRGGVGDDAYHLLYALARTHWLGCDLYPSHAACLETGPGAGVLLVGPSGCGKTTVALHMLARRPCNEVRVRMVSGNKTVLGFRAGHLVALGGTATVTAARADMEKMPVQPDGVMHYGTRVAGALPSGMMAAAGQRIVRIVFPRLCPGPGRSTRVPALRALHMLHPVLLDAVNADVVLAGGAGTYTDGCPLGSRRALGGRLASVLGDIEVLEAWGEAAYIADLACT